MRLVIVIPAYQAAKHLTALLARVLQTDVEVAAVLIVNDGSSDQTAEIADAHAREHGLIEVIHRTRNGGYGAAMKDGLSRAGQLGASCVACVHADGQYAPEALPRLLEVMQTEQLDLVQGSRIASGTALSGGMPLYKYVANRALTHLGNRVFGMKMSDYYSGYLVYGERALSTLPFARLSNSFDFDLEVVATSRAHALRVGEAPIPTHYGEETSHLNPWTYGLRVLRVMWSYKRGSYDVR